MIPIFASGNRRSLQRLKLLRYQAYADGASRVVTRLEAIMLSLQHKTSGQIAQLLQADRTRVHAWISAWNQSGEEGLWEGHRSGRPCQLEAAGRERLADIVESGPVAYGLNTAVWTSPLLAQIIAEEFGVDYHPGHVRRLLGQMGFSVQRPTTRLVQADPVKRRRWIRYQYPNLKKKPEPRKR
jgi:transposase